MEPLHAVQEPKGQYSALEMPKHTFQVRGGKKSLEEWDILAKEKHKRNVCYLKKATLKCLVLSKPDQDFYGNQTDLFLLLRQ